MLGTRFAHRGMWYQRTTGRARPVPYQQEGGRLLVPVNCGCRGHQVLEIERGDRVWTRERMVEVTGVTVRDDGVRVLEIEEVPQ